MYRLLNFKDKMYMYMQNKNKKLDNLQTNHNLDKDTGCEEILVEQSKKTIWSKESQQSVKPIAVVKPILKPSQNDKADQIPIEHSVAIRDVNRGQSQNTQIRSVYLCQWLQRRPPTVRNYSFERFNYDN